MDEPATPGAGGPPRPAVRARPRLARAARPLTFVALFSVLLVWAALERGPRVETFLLGFLWALSLLWLTVSSTSFGLVVAYRAALAATADASAETRKRGGHTLLGMSDRMSPAQSEGAAIQMLALSRDPDDELRWLSAKVVEATSAALTSTTSTAAFRAMVDLSTDGSPRTRSAAAMSMASVMARAEVRDSNAARAALERLLGDPEAAVRLWAMDATTVAGPSLEAPDLAALSVAVLRFVTRDDRAMAWKAGRSIAKMAGRFPPAFAESAVEELVALAGRARGDGAVDALALAAEVGANLGEEGATRAVEALVAQSEAGDGEPALQALRVAAIFSRGRHIQAGDATTKALARMAMAPDLARRDAAMLCLAVIGLAAGPFGKEVGADTAAEVAEHLTEHFRSPDGPIRRWARDLWPTAFALAPASARDKLVGRLVALHSDPDKNVRWAASSSLAAVRGELSADQLARSTREVAEVLRHPDGDTKRLATVTLVSLFETVGEPERAAIAAALEALGGDPDRVVADQAHDSLVALREIRTREAAAAHGKGR